MLGVLTPKTNTICRLFGMFKTPVKSFVPIKFWWPKIYQYNLHEIRIRWLFSNNAIIKTLNRLSCWGGERERENILIYQTPEILTYVLGTSWFRMHTYILVWCCLIYRSRPVWHSGYHLFVRAVEIQFVHVVDSHRIWKYICFLTGNMR